MEMSADMKKAQELGDKLRTQFGDSLRIRRLDAMKCEAEGNFDLAKEECDKILEEDPSNLFALKRQVAICRSQGRAAEAARKLTDYLATFCSDHEAWLMLCEIYLAAQVFKKASFCAEELVLINPMNYIYHLRAGDIVYTMGMSTHGGSHDQLLTARKYYAHALELKPGCLRALYGILLVCSAMGLTTKGKGTKVDTVELLTFVEVQLTKVYTQDGAPSAMRPLVLAMTKSLRANATASSA